MMFNGMRIVVDTTGLLSKKIKVKLPPTFLDQQAGNILFHLLFEQPEERFEIKIEETVLMIGPGVVAMSNASADYLAKEIAARSAGFKFTR